MSEGSERASLGPRIGGFDEEDEEQAQKLDDKLICYSLPNQGV